MGVGEAGGRVGPWVSLTTGRVLSPLGVASAASRAVRDTWELIIRAMMSRTREPLTAPMPICMGLLRALNRAARYAAPVLILFPRKRRPGFIHCHSFLSRGPNTFHTALAATATA